MRSAFLGVLLALGGTGMAQAAVLDFEAFDGPRFRTLGTTIAKQGYTLTADVGDFNAYPAGTVGTVPESGSTSILNGRSGVTADPSNGRASFTIARDGGLGFSFLGLRASEGRNAGPFARFGSTGIEVVGRFAAGGTISQALTFDGIASDDGAADFQSFALTGFEGLSSATISGSGGGLNGYSFGFDDLVVEAAAIAPVPLPAGLPLLVAGLGALGLLRRRRAV